jgi:hypothetical protein
MGRYSSADAILGAEMRGRLKVSKLELFPSILR